MDSFQNSFVARLITETLWGFPINEIVHILAISMVVGVVLVTSLNSINKEQIPFVILADYCAPLFWGGFVVALVSGLLFFISAPDRYLDNPAFWSKLCFVLPLPLFYSLFNRPDVVLPKKEGFARPGRRVWTLGLFICVAGAIISGRLMAFLVPAFF